jgi:hypothetical protein
VSKAISHAIDQRQQAGIVIFDDDVRRPWQLCDHLAAFVDAAALRIDVGQVDGDPSHSWGEAPQGDLESGLHMFALLQGNFDTLAMERELHGLILD